MPAPAVPSISVASSLACISSIFFCIWEACFIRPAMFFMAFYSVGGDGKSVRSSTKSASSGANSISGARIGWLGCRVEQWSGVGRSKAVGVGAAVVHRLDPRAGEGFEDGA